MSKNHMPDTFNLFVTEMLEINDLIVVSEECLKLEYRITRDEAVNLCVLRGVTARKIGNSTTAKLYVIFGNAERMDAYLHRYEGEATFVE
jgi:hypothetical protein